MTGPAAPSTPVAERPTGDYAPMTAMDRCDRCGAQAYMRAVFPGGADLTFCGHHGREYAAALAGSSVQLLDYTDTINEKPSQSSA